MELKLTAEWVLTATDGAHRLLRNGEVCVAGGRIAHVGPRSDLPASRTLDLGRAMLAPGFVDLNALADADTTILGLAGAAPHAKIWGTHYAPVARDVLSTEDVKAAARATFAQLLLSGVTTALPVTSLLFRRWAENAEEFEAVAELAGELGLRLVLGPSFRSSVNVVDAAGATSQVVDEEAGRRGLADAVRFIEALKSRPLLSGLLIPSTIDTCSDNLLKRTADAARDLEVPFRLHCCQSGREVDLIWARSGRTSIGHLAGLGVLSERALLPHAKLLGGPARDPELAEADLEALGQSGATIVYCPLVYARGGDRGADIGELLRRGVRIGMGTDTTPPNMVMNLQTGLAMSRMGGKGDVGPAELLHAATIAGAEALGRPDLGRIVVGAAADLVAWDLGRFEMQPIHDPVEALFLMPPGLRPAQVWVAGRHVVRDGRVHGLNEAAAGAALQAVFERLRAAFSDFHCQGLSVEAIFPPPVPTLSGVGTPSNP